MCPWKICKYFKYGAKWRGSFSSPRLNALSQRLCSCGKLRRQKQGEPHGLRWSEVRACSSGNTACFVWLSVFLNIYIIWGTDYELVGGLSFAPHSSSDCIPIGTLHRAEPSVGGCYLECVWALQGFDLPTHRVHLSHSSPDKDQRPRLVCSPARRPDW